MLAWGAAAALVVGAGAASGASSTTIITATIPSATSVVATGCAAGTPNITEFGVVQPGSTAVTSADCVITWGSSNATSMLRAFQSDGIGTAVGAPSGSWASKTTRDGGGYDDISAASSTTAYASAAGNGVSYTTTSGTSWSTWNPGATTVRDVVVAPGAANVAVSVGDSGSIWRTTTTGSSWPAEVSGTAQSLRSVSLIDSTNGFAVGATGTVVRRTTAGGATWVAVTSAGANLLTGVSAVNTNVVFVAGGGGSLYRSENAGSTWTAATGSCSYNYQDIVATDINTAFAVAYGGRVVKLVWNGATLACTDLGVQNIAEDLRGVATDGTWVYVAGVLGTLFRSNDGGANWSRLRSGTGVELGGVSAPSDGSVWVAGSSLTVARAPAATNFSVVRVESADSTTLTNVAAVSDTTAFVVGGQVDGGGTWRAAIRRTTNGGASWTSQNSNTTSALFGIDTVNDGTLAVAVGDAGTVVRTTDSGTTWTATSVAGATIRLWDVDMVDDTHGWAVGDTGTIVRTTNGGTSWTAQTSGVTNALTAVSAVDRDVAFAVGSGGRILRTTNGGTSWSILTGVPTSQPLDDVSAASATVVWVAFGYQQMLRSTDANAATPTWTLTSTGTGGDHLSIDTAGPNAVFVGGAWGLTSRTLNGSVWSTDTAPGSSIYVYGIDALDENSAWAVGNDNAVWLMEAAPATAFGDYADAGPNWTAASSLFGACLRDSTGVNVTPSWTVDATCTASGTGVWKGIPATSAAPDAKIAGATSATTGTARLRFGLKVAAAQPPGRYSAGISFEVLAPNA